MKYWTLSISFHENSPILFMILILTHSKDFAKIDLLDTINILWDQTLCNYCRCGLHRWVKLNPLSYIFPKRSNLCQRYHKYGVKIFGVGYYYLPSTFSILFLFFLKIFVFQTPVQPEFIFSDSKLFCVKGSF